MNIIKNWKQNCMSDKWLNNFFFMEENFSFKQKKEQQHSWWVRPQPHTVSNSMLNFNKKACLKLLHRDLQSTTIDSKTGRLRSTATKLSD